ncbi:16667_t:CDS:10, partial [Funneliformis geosporum]
MEEDSHGEAISQTSGGGTTTSLASACEPIHLQDYFNKILPLVLGAESSDLENSLWSVSETTDRIKRFINDPQVNAIYFTKKRKDRKDEDEQATVTYTYTCTQEITYHSNNVANVTFIKLVTTLDNSRSIQSQIQLINLPGPASNEFGSAGVSPYEALHSYIHLAVAPYFDAYVREKSPGEGVFSFTGKKLDDSKLGIPMAKKKIAELELSLRHLQQNVEIPEISLNIHERVRDIVKKCKSDETRVSVDIVDQSLLSDSQFLNKLQGDVNGWIKEIKKVTELTRDPSSGTAIQEINFWLSMETALEGIDEQLKSDEIELTLSILRQAKRFHTTTSFVSDTGLKEVMDKVHKYNQLMKDFPLSELLSAPDVNKVKDSLHLIFMHFNKKLRLSPYPIKKALALVEAISRDLNDQLLKVLGSRRLMYMDYDDFEKVMAGAEDVFRTWDEMIKEFTNVARDMTRKRQDKFIPIKISPAHDKLQERVYFVRNFRKQHEQLHQTIVKVMSQPKGTTSKIMVEGEDKVVRQEEESVNMNDVNSMEEIKLAYESVKDIDVLDVSIEGTELWMQAENAYNERVSRVENQIIASLRDRLGTCKNANEMFRVFSKFNALFVRPKIRGAIQEYQTQLIENVKEDIKKLQDKFTKQYRKSEAYHMAQLRDLPAISGAMIWARQIERQLQAYMKRVEDVLGKGWELYSEGQKLQTDSNNFRKKLDTRPIFEAWQNDITKGRDLNVSGRLFEITKNRAQGNILQLGVNFDPQIITLFKEVRNLLWLNHQVPHNIGGLAKTAKRVYPFAVSLMETVRTYAQTVQKVQKHPEIIMLIASYRNDVQNMIAKGINYEWRFFVETYDRHFRPNLHITGGTLESTENQHVTFVREFANQVSIFQDKVDALITSYDDISRLIEDLKTCAYKSRKLQLNLDKIQKVIDMLNLESYSNLNTWVSQLDKRVETVLVNRLQQAISAWTAEFMISGDESANSDSMSREAVSISGKVVKKNRRRTTRNDSMDGEKPVILKAEKPSLIVSTHEVRIRNQVIYLDPPIEDARANWYNQLHEWLAIVCNLPRLQSSRYDIDVQVRGTICRETSYSNLLTQLPDNSLEKAYDVIEAKLKEVSEYVNVWFQFQSLWDLEANNVYAILGDDLLKWQQILTEIKKSRNTFDNSDTSRSFGPIEIDYQQAQSKVNAKYDSWQREVLNKFGNKIADSMRDFHTNVSHARKDLENQSMESNNTSEAVTLITFVQDLKRKVAKWNQDVEVFRNGQKTLERQRYQFPSDWIYVENIEGEWSAFNEILNRKNNAIQEQIAGLQMKIVTEDKVVEDKIKKIVADWDETKPIQGNIKPDIATNTLTIFEGRVTRLKEEYDMVCRAKEALDMALTSEDRLDPVLEELRDLKSVWNSLSKVWQSINELKDQAWSSAVPRKIRQQLSNILDSTKEMPSRMRTYAAFEYVQIEIKKYIKVNPVLSELKSEAMKDRHWKKLFKELRLEGRWLLPELTVGNIWDMDLSKNEQVIRDYVTQASGEMALEEFLKGVKETWSSYVLELVNYQNRCRLIKGWDELFTKCSENLNSLTAMKMSPYYKTFEEDASTWEDKLNRIHVLFDVWIDVQRQWVYLEGIFSGSADIKHLLPVETQRFTNINTEFLGVMKKVYKSPFVVDVLNIPNVQKSLERLSDLLSKIQKALGEYLERERSSFPRFYFVGDEDLLEIIGNSKDVVRIQKHFKKMFAGISNILLSDDLTIIEGMASREGEEVPFIHPISIKENPKINDWLTLIEKEMRVSLAEWLTKAVIDLNSFYLDEELVTSTLLEWIAKYPSQLVVVAVQIIWTQSVDKALSTMEMSDRSNQTPLNNALDFVLRSLEVLADTVLTELPQTQRKKCEHLITELVHQRDVLRQLLKNKISSPKDFEWLYQMRFYFNASLEDPLVRLTIHMANAQFLYGYEYLGVPDRLVQTPLTDRCYLTLTQALSLQLGGSPFGPGTGKTESVKALGVQLGRFVLVFCCDENFDFQAMGRIFVGLCQVGAWGCFDEFNRLEERILSAVSQQVQTIQLGLKAITTNPTAEVEIVGKSLTVNANTGIFITMNPGYAGRSNLPDNLKKLFRSMAMTKPDRELISQVMLYSQGFRTAEILASKVVPLFNLCAEQLSPQAHYDFGLRALKCVLVSAGNLKRERLQSLRDKDCDESEYTKISEPIPEQEIVIQSIRETIVPKLVADDIPLLASLLADVFPGVEYVPVDLEKLTNEIKNVCQEKRLLDGEMWMEKVLQLYQIQNLHHGLMMVGPSGSGKTMAWKVLLEALERVQGVEGVSYVIDPKAISKDALYGTLDPTTREWVDGLFTHILRKIVDNVRGESSKRHWIIFDGDVDPEWVENLNSVLDDNKLLTLPNGERLSLPQNVRIMFEVENLKYATLATVSRCGMVWFSEEVCTLKMIYTNYLETLKVVPLDDNEEENSSASRKAEDGVEESISPNLTTQRAVAQILGKHMTEDGFVTKTLEHAEKLDHIMDFTAMRVLNTLFSLMNKTVRNIIEYNAQHPDFPMSAEHLESYVTKRLVIGVIWSFSGDAKLELRSQLGDFVRGIITTVDLPPSLPGSSIIDYDVQINNGEWVAWTTKVPTIEIETHTVAEADVVIPTVDTVRHEEVLYSWLSEHKPLMLCGPPGSGKTMTLFSALRKLPDMEVVGLNFSSATTPELILKTFEQYCEYRKTPNGVILSPLLIGRWIVVFCDEINLPATDKYGTQRVISFLRQLIEYGGYWRTTDKAWVKLERIQFVGACNPPTDPGRVPLTHRFLRHSPLVMVDYPGEISLNQIYGTFSRAMLKVVPALRAYAEPLTAAMVDFYLASQKHFTPDIQAHYIYSPRELTRWMRGIFEAIKPMETLSLEGLVRIWAHEALRLFQDRLVTEEEKKWTDDNIDSIAMKHFPNLNQHEALGRPILFSNWLSKYYIPVEREDLRDYVKARLKVFYEEELDVPLVLFNDVLDHVLRIDRVFRQMQGHLLLIGVSGSGKTTLSRFVAWMNGLSVFQIKAHNKYTGDDFDEDLRVVLRRSGCKGEKICFIMDESNVLDSGFLERMNTLLANAEVPGLFEGDEYNTLMTGCKEGAQREGLMLDSQEELYKWFTQQVMKNLHVVFTMNPPEGGLASRAATSPALFNRCVLDWFGDWSDQAFFQVGMEFTHNLDLDIQNYSPPANFPIAYRGLALPPIHRNAIVNAFVFVHQSLYDINAKLSKRQGRYNYVTPRHYLDFINHYVRLFNEKREDLEEQQRHLNVGLDKLKETVVTVEELRVSLAKKKEELLAKDKEANEKLKKMVGDQQIAEEQKKESEKIQVNLSFQNEEITARRSIVMKDLANAEPAVEEAKKSVQGIKKQHLSEVRAMANPPEAVKLAMTSVCTLLGFKIDSWKAVQGIIRRDDFIASIVNFDTDVKMTRPLREKMINEYMNKPQYNYEQVNRASKACGPLVKWACAQVNYSEILDRIGPLRNEVDQLQKKQEETKMKAVSMQKMISELEDKIKEYKSDYESLISQKQTIQDVMLKVKTKVDRSLTLLSSLSSEKERWESGSQAFETQMGTIVGDVLLSSAFLAYGGYFDQQYREILISKWTSHLVNANLQFKQDLSLTEYLSTADDRLSWQEKSLPADDLCTENAIMLKRFNRYPLIIDPSGQATGFLKKEFENRKISITSFLDDSFTKNLESALRFGNPLLIQDVEHLDPILNAVLNKELRRTGGRVLIRLGGQDIDFSPSFTLFLSTRDPSVNFPPDVCSRVTFVNFTVTRGSLQSQCLNQVLKVERPDTDQKRTDLIKLQGEFKLKLRHLEKSLLQALNDSKGNILDDAVVLDTLETLKKEAAEITQKVQETESIMKEVEEVTAQYTPLAQACSSVFFVMEQMNLLHHFYQFSLEYFYEIFEYILHENPNLKDIKDTASRLEILKRDLFNVSFKRVSRSLTHEDYVTYAILLSQIKLRGSPNAVDEVEYDYLLSGGDVIPGSTATARELGLPADLFDSDQLCKIKEFTTLPCFSKLTKHIASNLSDWKEFLSTDPAETCVPVCWDSGLPASVVQLRKILLVKCFRPDRLIPAVTQLVGIAFDPGFINQTDLDFQALVLDEIQPATPISLCSVPGYDASFRVDNLVAELNVRCTSVAMGSQEGFTLADQAIANSIKNGNWVLLKNVHLAPSWLGQLEKKLHSMKAHKNFRLFLTMETNPKVPVNLLRLSRILMFEPPPGIKANLTDSLKAISPSRLQKGPTERIRLYFMLAWLHAIVQERLRYCPLGWTKIYEFNESDQDFAINTIDTWLDSVAQGRTNISPDKIPWEAMRSLITISGYGGRIDNEFDKRLLECFVNSLFTPAAYDLHFSLVDVEGSDNLVTPEGSKIDQFMNWVNKLPERQPPVWLGLPSNAEKVLSTSKGYAMLTNIRKMKSLSDDDEVAYTQESSSESSGASAQPAWMRALYSSVENWLKILPEKVTSMNRTADSIKNPLFRFFDRENQIGRALLKKIRQDLADIKKVCDGELKQTNHLRMLLNCLTKGIIPDHWRKYKVPKTVSLNHWIADFKSRLQQLESITSESYYGGLSVWLGGLFMPEAYVTATRQAVAQSHKWSLEELRLEIDLNRKGDKDSFIITGLKLSGAEWNNNQVRLVSSPFTKLEESQIRWVLKSEAIETDDQTVQLPVYLNEDRSDLLFIINASAKKDDKDKVAQRATRILGHSQFQMEGTQKNYHKENYPLFPSRKMLGNSLQLKPLKETKFSQTHKILSSTHVQPSLKYIPYDSILPQKNNDSQDYDDLSDSESLVPFKKDTIIYLDHKSTNENNKNEIISGEEEENKDGIFAIIIDTRSDNDISKFKNEISLNCDDCFINNENSIIYERGTNCILSYEELEQNDDDDEINKLDHNVDKSLIISIKKCFNCSSPHHSVNDCILPLNQELIKINREKFNSIGGQHQFN